MNIDKIIAEIRADTFAAHTLQCEYPEGCSCGASEVNDALAKQRALCDSHERLKKALENLTKEFIHCRKFYGPDSRTPTGREYDEAIEAAREALKL